MKFILSPCGTSLLTNNIDDATRKLIYRYTNCDKEEKIPAEDRKKLSAYISERSDQLLKTTGLETARKMSAELNGIISIYDGNISGKEDYHFLLSTDTWLGEETAKMVKSWLEQQAGLVVQVHRQKDLQTANLDSFRWALSDLMKTFSDTLPGYKSRGYKVIFNLTGGFKSVQGFLQSIANFYADEAVYIFESSKELLRIPKLPVSLQLQEEVEKNLYAFRRLSQKLSIGKDEHDISKTLIFECDGDIALSEWGELVWGQLKDACYKKKLHPSPSPKIRYSEKFEKNVQDIAEEFIQLINHRIDQLANLLEKNESNPLSLNFKPLRGKPMPPSTHEMDAWSHYDAKRLFGHFEEEVFVIDQLAKGLH